MARKLSYDVELAKKMIAYLAAGIPVSTACKLCKFSKDTHYRWIKIGQEYRDGVTRTKTAKICHQYLLDIEKAEAAQQEAAIRGVTRQFSTDWRAAAWYLERTDPDNFGKKDKLEHTGDFSFSVVPPPPAENSLDGGEEQ